MQAGRPPARAAGFTYVGVLLLVSVAGLALASTSTVWHFEVQREKERELLFIGNQFRTALDRYAAAPLSTVGPRFPTRLEELLLDNRTPARLRHLRRIYRDPMTGGEEWGLIRTADGQIIGVHSLSDAPAIKQANFSTRDQGLTGRSTYRQWVFMATTARSSLQVLPPPAGLLVGPRQRQ
jgi:type II secretory pathway pseudopilin PulG